MFLQNVSQGPNLKGSGVCGNVPQGSTAKGSDACERFYIGDGPQGSERVVVVPEPMGNDPPAVELGSVANSSDDPELLRTFAS